MSDDSEHRPPTKPSAFASRWPRPPSAAAAIARLLRDAEVAWSEQDYAKSMALIEKARRSDPGNPALLLELAKAHGLRFEYAAARRAIDKALRLSPRPAETLTEAGRVCLDFGQVELAIGYLERACRAKQTPISALILLADLSVRDRRLDDAAELAERAAGIDREDPRVVLTRAELARRLGRSEEAERPLRAVTAKADVGAAVRVRALYELAGILDDTGRCDEAMSTWLEAKAIQRGDAARLRAELGLIQQRCLEMERTIGAEVLERWRAEAPSLAPARRIALLCGHPRSGTTLLEQVLDAHPGILSAEETRLMHDEAYLPLIHDHPEGTSILDALDAATPSLLRRTREHYFRCAERFLGEPVGDRLLLDKNPPLNALIPMVVRVFPEARFLVALRDPRDVVLSCFQQSLALTPISSAYLSLEETVRHYASSMGFWLAMRPRLAGRFREVHYEDLVDDLPDVARATLEFLGVDFDPAVLRYDDRTRLLRAWAS